MNILLEPDITEEIKEKYLLLELDSFRVAESSQPIRAYCLVEFIQPDDMVTISQWVDLHANLMPEYRKQNWNYVEQAIEHLMGRWNSQLDSFYQDILARVKDMREQTLDEAWDGVIDRR